MKRNIKILLISALLLLSARAFGQSEGRYLVLGAIASSENGVALLKDNQTKRTFAARAGTKIDSSHELIRINNGYVYMKIHGKMTRIRVGFSEGHTAASSSLHSGSSREGLEVSGTQVRITGMLRNHLVKQELSSILMQAAAVPHYKDGSLVGFRLWEIEAGSIYEQTGFKNGDIVIRIEDNDLTDVGMTVKMLHALKEASSAEIVLIRDNKEQTMNFIID